MACFLFVSGIAKGSFRNYPAPLWIKYALTPRTSYTPYPPPFRHVNKTPPHRTKKCLWHPLRIISGTAPRQGVYYCIATELCSCVCDGRLNFVKLNPKAKQWQVSISYHIHIDARHWHSYNIHSYIAIVPTYL